MKIQNWFNGQTLEFDMLHGAMNVEHSPNSFYARAIIYDPVTQIRSYQKLIAIHFEEEDKLDN